MWHGCLLAYASFATRYGRQFEANQECEHRVDHNFRAAWTSQNANRWLGVRLQLAGSVIILVVTMAVGVTHQQLGPGMVGFLMSYVGRVVGVPC